MSGSLPVCRNTPHFEALVGMPAGRLIQQRRGFFLQIAIEEGKRVGIGVVRVPR
jgi:hypothetical protein